VLFNIHAIKHVVRYLRQINGFWNKLRCAVSSVRGIGFLAHVSMRQSFRNLHSPSQ
jgi:hypothetical protein